MAQSIEVAVIGGGCAGVLAANRLTQRDKLTVTLINLRPTFVERIRLHQVVGGSDAPVVEDQQVPAEDVPLMVGTAAHSWPVASSRSPPPDADPHRRPRQPGTGRREESPDGIGRTACITDPTGPGRHAGGFPRQRPADHR